MIDMCVREEDAADGGSGGFGGGEDGGGGAFEGGVDEGEAVALADEEAVDEAVVGELVAVRGDGGDLHLEDDGTEVGWGASKWHR